MKLCPQCDAFFARYQCSAGSYGECDCPRCQGYCTCHKPAKPPEIAGYPLSFILVIGAVLLALVVLQEYQKHRIVADLNILCFYTGNHDVWMGPLPGHPLTLRQKIDNICIEHNPEGQECPPGLCVKQGKL
jgi:hypothetical protein